MEGNDSLLRQEHQMQRVILTTSQIGKEKSSNEHNADCWRNLNVDYILDNNIDSILNFMNSLYDYVRGQPFS